MRDQAMQGRRGQIVRYYDECEVDFRIMWRLGRVMAMHYGYWDERVRGLTSSLRRMNEVLAERVGIRADDHVLDAGCGVGGSAIFIALRYGCRVTGVTLSRRQARTATRHATRLGVSERVRFVAADYTALPFEDASFDVVWALESACYAEPSSALLAEAHRVLRTGQRLVVADAFAAAEDLRPDEVALLENWLRCWAVESVDTRDRFAGHLQRAGFDGIDYRDITREVMPSSRRLYRGSLYAMTVTRLCERLGFRSRVQTDNVAGCRRQYRAFRRGLAHYGIFVAHKPGPGAATPSPSPA